MLLRKRTGGYQCFFLAGVCEGMDRLKAGGFFSQVLGMVWTGEMPVFFIAGVTEGPDRWNTGVFFLQVLLRA